MMTVLELSWEGPPADERQQHEEAEHEQMGNYFLPSRYTASKACRGVAFLSGRQLLLFEEEGRITCDCEFYSSEKGRSNGSFRVM